jgi:hypothetical protein
MDRWASILSLACLAGAGLGQHGDIRNATEANMDKDDSLGQSVDFQSDMLEEDHPDLHAHHDHQDHHDFDPEDLADQDTEVSSDYNVSIGDWLETLLYSDANESPEDHSDQKHSPTERHYEHPEHDHSIHGWSQEAGPRWAPLSTWLVATCSVLVISVAGLATVGLLPLLRGRREPLLALLVAMAVGTLLGDALMHLLPHALGTPHGDSGPVWRGFLATVTLILLFGVDQLMALYGHGHSHGTADPLESERESVEEFTYIPRGEGEGPGAGGAAPLLPPTGGLAEKASLAEALVLEPPPEYSPPVRALPAAARMVRADGIRPRL